MKTTFAQLQKALQCQVHLPSTVALEDVVIDSRKITPGCLFVALRGERFDGHDFLNDVANAGAAAVVAEHVPENFKLPALIVPDTRKALGDLALAWRAQFNALQLITVVGSNGKTTVKEMIASVLKVAFGEGHFLATQGNFNNDIGVPLTLFRLNENHKAAVVELGMNHPGEIDYLTRIALPTVGVINNAQREHLEFMQNVEAVANENGAMIPYLPGVAVFPSDDAFSDLWRRLAQCTVMTFSLNAHADVMGVSEPTQFGNIVRARIGDERLTIRLSAPGIHNAKNALAAITACRAIGCSNDDIVKGLENFRPVQGRMQIKQTHNNATVIDDTYNANPDSVRAAVDVLAEHRGNTIAVLGDMGEVGDKGADFHKEIGAYAKEKGINALYTLGDLAEQSSSAFGQGAQHFDKIEALLSRLDKHITPKSTVLVKGSRFMKMERVVAHLMQG